MSEKTVTTEDENKCSVCGHFKMPGDEYCRDCASWKKTREDQIANRKREQAFGDIWGFRGK